MRGSTATSTRRNLATLAEERGDRAEAVRLWAEVEAECPGDREVVRAAAAGNDRGRRGGGAVKLERLLFASCHGYLDPSNGAATATRDLMELLTSLGVDCRVLSTGVFDYDRETPLETVINALGVPAERCAAPLSRGGVADVYDLTLSGVRASPCCRRRPAGSNGHPIAQRARRSSISPTRSSSGSAPGALDLRRTPAGPGADVPSPLPGIAVVFHLHNFGYNDRASSPTPTPCSSHRVCPPLPRAAGRPGLCRGAAALACGPGRRRRARNPGS